MSKVDPAVRVRVIRKKSDRRVRCDVLFQVVGTCKTSAGFARIMMTVTTAHSSAIVDHVKEAE